MFLKSSKSEQTCFKCMDLIEGLQKPHFGEFKMDSPYGSFIQIRCCIIAFCSILIFFVPFKFSFYIVISELLQLPRFK